MHPADFVDDELPLSEGHCEGDVLPHLAVVQLAFAKVNVGATCSEGARAEDTACAAARGRCPHNSSEPNLLQVLTLRLALVVASNVKGDILALLETSRLTLVQEYIAAVVDPRAFHAGDEAVALPRGEGLDDAAEAPVHVRRPHGAHVARVLLPLVEVYPSHSRQLGRELDELPLMATRYQERILIHFAIEEGVLPIASAGLRDAVRGVLPRVLVLELRHHELLPVIDLCGHILPDSSGAEVEAVRALEKVKAVDTLWQVLPVGVLQMAEQHGCQEGVIASLMRQF
mmetsp:Transcript_99348/g.289948  ORF Transcript_99348/g.289948 Transcript_99348/m.289948 type:complete len:286 (-) Transcript_99348:1078-1935(-)